MRHELKYFVNDYQVHMLAKKLSVVCKKDKFLSDKDHYRVSSLYFDDYINSCVEDKFNGIHNRKKFRIRVYNLSSNVIKLERKMKKNNLCQKDSVQITLDEYTNILNGSVEFLKNKNNEVANDFYHLYHSRKLRPVVVVDYYRMAFISKYGNVRITFDSNLCFWPNQHDLFSDYCAVSALDRESIILEVKYTGYLPDYIKDMVQGLNAPLQAVSKYTHCRSFR